MSVEELVLKKLLALPDPRKHEVLDFVEFLAAKPGDARPRKSIEGLWAGLGFDITEKDIEDARREMWGKVGRKDV